MFAELPAEHVPGPPPLAPGVRHDAWLLTDRRESFIDHVMADILHCKKH